MRPSRTVARAALTAALAVGALPGLVGSHEPAQARTVDAALFEQVTLATAPETQGRGPVLLDASLRSAGLLAADAPFAEAGAGGLAAGAQRPLPRIAVTSSWDWQPARSTLRG